MSSAGRVARRRLGATLPMLGAAVATVYPNLLPLTALVRGPRASPRSVVLWAIVIVPFAVAALVRREFGPALLALAFGLVVDLGATRLRGRGPTRSVWVGVLAGVVALTVVGVAQVAVLGDGRAAGPTWMGHPNLFAHYLLVAIGVLALTVPGRARAGVLLLGLLAVSVTGSRSGLLGYAVTLVGLAATTPRWRRPVGIAGIVAVLAVGALVVFSFGPWADRIVYLARALVPRDAPVNVLLSTEDLADPRRWNHLGVSVARIGEDAEGVAVWRIAREEPGSWRRPQQTVELQGRTAYTLAGELLLEPGRTPGFVLWRADPEAHVDVATWLTATGEPRVEARAGLASVEASSVALGEGWWRLELTFALAADEPVRLAVGPAPDLGSDAVGASVAVRRIQLEAGEDATAYRPTVYVESGVGEARSRLEAFATAIDGFTRSPVVGNGQAAFPTLFAARDPESIVVPAHAHNAFLDVAFSYGLLGLAGFGVLLSLLFVEAVAAWRWVLAGVLVANLFDSTLLTTVVLPPLVAGSALTAAAPSAERAWPRAQDSASS